jgi:hypothetical protein
MFLRNVGRLSTDYTALQPPEDGLFITAGVRISNPAKNKTNFVSGLPYN